MTHGPWQGRQGVGTLTGRVRRTRCRSTVVAAEQQVACAVHLLHAVVGAAPIGLAERAAALAGGLALAALAPALASASAAEAQPVRRQPGLRWDPGCRTAGGQRAGWGLKGGLGHHSTHVQPACCWPVPMATWNRPRFTRRNAGILAGLKGNVAGGDPAVAQQLLPQLQRVRTSHPLWIRPAQAWGRGSGSVVWP